MQVHGTCLGFEALAVVVSGNYTILSKYVQWAGFLLSSQHTPWINPHRLVQRLSICTGCCLEPGTQAALVSSVIPKFSILLTRIL